MSDASLAAPGPVTFDAPAAKRPTLDAGFNPRTAVVFFGILAVALFFIAYSVYSDVTDSGVRTTNWIPYLLLGVALFIALGFEFVNGFHDTANAVATVIYTHSLPAHLAVVWSGLFNFLGVMVASGAVAYGIIALLPVELILQVGSSSGFAMVFALLIGAIIWNLGTWYLGLPASSSHTLIGSIIGVGLANQLMHSAGGASGVDWAQASKVGYSLLLSPLIGFGASALLLLVLKVVAKSPALYSEPKGDAPPPWWIRGILILTCTGVSFAHGSNDGQKGMGLIMLILIGVVPATYALNLSTSADRMQSATAPELASSKSRDPDNKLLWRMNPRRMEAEAVRDSALAIGGQLIKTLHGADIDQEEGLKNFRRSLYFRSAKEKKVLFLSIFDSPNVTDCYRRAETVVPQQALAMVNSPLTLEQSRRMAQSLSKEVGEGDKPELATKFIRTAFEQILCRAPTAREESECQLFLKDITQEFRNQKTLTKFDGPVQTSVAPATDPHQRAREGLILVLLNHNDFVTVR